MELIIGSVLIVLVLLGLYAYLNRKVRQLNERDKVIFLNETEIRHLAKQIDDNEEAMRKALEAYEKQQADKYRNNN